MSNEQTIYLSPLCDWRIVMCSKLWGIVGYEVEHKKSGFWQTIYDGEFALDKCFIYLRKMNVISRDEMNAEMKRWK